MELIPDLEHERALSRAGAERIVGIDEVGRGALAGPVVAAAVMLPLGTATEAALSGLRDSKQLSPASRDALGPRIREVALAWGIGEVSAHWIDGLGIVRATELAMCRAIRCMPAPPDFLLVDGFPIRMDARPQQALIKGDARALSIAAASVVAKLYRDALMIDHARRSPVYAFDRNKGYGTAEHRRAIQAWGICGLHRRTWALTPDHRRAQGQERRIYSMRSSGLSDLSCTGLRSGIQLRDRSGFADAVMISA